MNGVSERFQNTPLCQNAHCICMAYREGCLETLTIDIQREQVTGFAVIDCETQLLGISSETVDKIGVSLAFPLHIDTPPCYRALWAYFKRGGRACDGNA